MLTSKRQDPDLLRWFHKGLTFVRTLRGDDVALDQDHKRERLRGNAALKTIDKIARTAAGCVAPNPCSCPLCSEKD